MGGIRHLTGGTPQIIEHVRGQLLSSRLLRGEAGYGLDPCWRCHDMIFHGFVINDVSGIDGVRLVFRHRILYLRGAAIKLALI
jgi:hypothetical protein